MDYIDGDVYFNPCFEDLWVVKDRKFVLINQGHTIDVEDPMGFIKVGHIEMEVK